MLNWVKKSIKEEYETLDTKREKAESRNFRYLWWYIIMLLGLKDYTNFPKTTPIGKSTRIRIGTDGGGRLQSADCLPWVITTRACVKIKPVRAICCTHALYTHKKTTQKKDSEHVTYPTAFYSTLKKIVWNIKWYDFFFICRTVNVLSKVCYSFKGQNLGNGEKF